MVDVLISDHHAPRVTERLAGRDMVRIEGGTQALRRTINARLEIEPGTITTVSVHGAFGALILKVAAYKTDSRDPDRHLRDAVALLACIDDPFAERERFTGSDRSRLQTLRSRLTPDDISWTVLTGQPRIDAETALGSSPTRTDHGPVRTQVFQAAIAALWAEPGHAGDEPAQPCL